jgi:hypothetical protein
MRHDVALDPTSGSKGDDMVSANLPRTKTFEIDCLKVNRIGTSWLAAESSNAIEWLIVSNKFLEVASIEPRNGPERIGGLQ